MKAKKETKKSCENSRDKAQTHSCKAESSLQQGPSDSVPCASTSDIRNQESDFQPHENPDSVISNQTLGHLDWLGSLNGIEDHALCECCGQQDFFEEYLHQIDSGQRLCPRCHGELKKKVQILAADQILCT